MCYQVLSRSGKIVIYIYIYVCVCVCVYVCVCDIGVGGVMVTVIGNGQGGTSSNPGRVSISHSTNTFRKGTNLIILPPAMGK